MNAQQHRRIYARLKKVMHPRTPWLGMMMEDARELWNHGEEGMWISGAWCRSGVEEWVNFSDNTHQKKDQHHG